MGATCVRECERERSPTGHDVKAVQVEAFQILTAPCCASSNSASFSSLDGMKCDRTSDPLAVPNWFEADLALASQVSTPRESEDEHGPGNDEEGVYEGGRFGHMKHGIGCLRMKGYTYQGEFEHDAKHGVGVLKYEDGRQYHGQFRDGQFHGHAIMTWPDGRRYCGQFAYNRKHGEGARTWPDGRRYQGEWVAGKRHGKGTYTNSKGVSRLGMWHMDKPLTLEPAPAAGQPPIKPLKKCVTPL